MTRRSALLLPLLAAACDLAPRYARPAPTAPSSFPQGGAYAPDRGASSVAAIGWRSFFVDPRLRDTIALGLANNRDLAVAAANIAQARAQYRIQRADLLPTVLGGGSAAVRRTGDNGTSVSIGGAGGGGSGNLAGGTNGNGNSVGGGGTGGVGTGSTGTDTGTGGNNGTGAGTGGASSFSSAGRTVDTYSLFAGVSNFELDLFGRLRNLTKAAQQQYLATRAGADATRISLISEIARAWLTMASDQDQLDISRKTLASFRESVRITSAQFQRGTVSELDVRQADTNLQQARADVARLTAQIAQDQNALDLLAGTTVPLDLLPDALGPGIATLPDLPAGVSSAVLLNRPDVVQAEDQLRAEYANIGTARAAFFPTISLTTAAGTASGGLAGLFTGGSFSWNASSSGILPLFDFGRRRASLDYAKASRDAAVANYQRTVQIAFREVSDTLAVRGTIGEQIAAQDARVASASRAAFLSDARYRAGIDQYLTTLDAQRTAYTARQVLVTTRLQRVTNLVQLYAALGGGLG